MLVSPQTVYPRRRFCQDPGRPEAFTNPFAQCTGYRNFDLENCEPRYMLFAMTLCVGYNAGSVCESRLRVDKNRDG